MASKAAPATVPVFRWDDLSNPLAGYRWRAPAAGRDAEPVALFEVCDIAGGDEPVAVHVAMASVAVTRAFELVADGLPLTGADVALYGSTLELLATDLAKVAWFRQRNPTRAEGKLIAGLLVARSMLVELGDRAEPGDGVV